MKNYQTNILNNNIQEIHKQSVHVHCKNAQIVMKIKYVIRIDGGEFLQMDE